MSESRVKCSCSGGSVVPNLFWFLFMVLWFGGVTVDGRHYDVGCGKDGNGFKVEVSK